LEDCYLALNIPSLKERRRYDDKLTSQKGYRKLRFIIPVRYGEKVIDVEIQIMTEEMYRVGESLLDHTIYKDMGLGHRYDSLYSIKADLEEYRGRFDQMKLNAARHKRTYFFLDRKVSDDKGRTKIETKLLFVPETEANRSPTFVDVLAHPEVDLLGRVRADSVRVNGRRSGLGYEINTGDRILLPQSGRRNERSFANYHNWGKHATSPRAKLISNKLLSADNANVIKKGHGILTGFLVDNSFPARGASRDIFLAPIARELGLDMRNWLGDLELILGEGILSEEMLEHLVYNVVVPEDGSKKFPLTKEGIPGGREIAGLVIEEKEDFISVTAGNITSQEDMPDVGALTAIGEALGHVRRFSEVFNSEVPVKLVQESDRVFRINWRSTEIELDIDAPEHAGSGLLALGLHHEYQHAALSKRGLPKGIEEIIVLLEDLYFAEKLIAEGVVTMDRFQAELSKLSDDDKRYGDFLQRAVNSGIREKFEAVCELVLTEVSGKEKELIEDLRQSLDTEKTDDTVEAVIKWYSSNAEETDKEEPETGREIALIHFDEGQMRTEPAEGFDPISGQAYLQEIGTSFKKIKQGLKNSFPEYFLEGTALLTVAVVENAKHPVVFDSDLGMLYIDSRCLRWPAALLVEINFQVASGMSESSLGFEKTSSALMQSFRAVRRFSNRGQMARGQVVQQFEFLNDSFPDFNNSVLTMLLKQENLEISEIITKCLSEEMSLENQARLLVLTQTEAGREQVLGLLGSISGLLAGLDAGSDEEIISEKEQAVMRLVADRRIDGDDVSSAISRLVLNGEREALVAFFSALPSDQLLKAADYAGQLVQNSPWTLPGIRDALNVVLKNDGETKVDNFLQLLDGTDLGQAVSSSLALDQEIHNLSGEIDAADSDPVLIDLEMGTVQLENGNEIMIPEAIIEAIKTPFGEGPAGLRVKDPAAFTDILEYLMVKRDAIQSDPFLQKSFWNRMD
ncbi:MAG: hypothetical protein P9M03_04055, partial [Candidatus Theseobacter exili]|nr:hypothetical protein [Candidatus Theseobacter exili]